MTTPAPLDEMSKQIIEHLQEDGRQSYATIGRAVGLSEAAVRPVSYTHLRAHETLS